MTHRNFVWAARNTPTTLRPFPLKGYNSYSVGRCAGDNQCYGNALYMRGFEARAEIATSPSAAANVRRLHSNLANVLAQAALDSIESEINHNIAQLFALGGHTFCSPSAMGIVTGGKESQDSITGHTTFPVQVRLCVTGEYSTDPSDHKKIDNLPDDFPNKNTYANRLAILREDRNLCALRPFSEARRFAPWSVDDSAEIVESFLRDARKYLERPSALGYEPDGTVNRFGH